MVKNTLQIEYLRLDLIRDYKHQFRQPSKKQAVKAQRMIRECGFIPPLVIDGDHTVVIGQHFLDAARALKMEDIPVIRTDFLDEAQIRMLRVSYERIAEEATWDHKALAAEFRELEILLPDIDLTWSGFEVPEIDIILDDSSKSSPEDQCPAPGTGPRRVELGDLWQLGPHRLYCGDALKTESYHCLLKGERADLCFTDAPYNVKIKGHVGNSGAIQHREFVMASGEMTKDEFSSLLTTVHQKIAAFTQKGAVIYSCMDWRHLHEMVTAGEASALELLNLCVWVKDNGGMGSFYRSRYELVFVFRNGTEAHLNNIQLGKYGRYRTNVWEYPGVNSFGGGRMKELALHPTVKPVEMVADAIKDSSRRGCVVLDPFGGSGTTLIAAEQTDRQARLIELDPLYCDVILYRWEAMTGQKA
ncbi:MAG: DNA methylase N-4, partial [Cyanobacteria bacterium PR.023]|nr:DNA methylase N-4 [Cyanobacteria bacterium PR.023]